MSNIAEKIQKSLEEYLSRTHPEEKLRELTIGNEQLNIWLTFFLLGPIASVGMRNYYIGLTDNRVLFMTLSWWTNSPSDQASEIFLGRIIEMTFKPGLLTGKLRILYGENMKRTFTIQRHQFENTKKFVDTFSLLPKPSLTDEEIIQARVSEETHEQDARERVIWAVIIFVGLLFLFIMLNLIATA